MPSLLLALIMPGAIGCARPPVVPPGPDLYVVTAKEEGVRTRVSREGGPTVCVWHEIVSLKCTETQAVIRIEYPVLPYLDSRDELLDHAAPGDALKVVLREIHYAREGIIGLHASRIDITRPPGSPPRKP